MASGAEYVDIPDVRCKGRKGLRVSAQNKPELERPYCWAVLNRATSARRGVHRVSSADVCHVHVRT